MVSITERALSHRLLPFLWVRSHVSRCLRRHECRPTSVFNIKIFRSLSNRLVMSRSINNLNVCQANDSECPPLMCRWHSLWRPEPSTDAFHSFQNSCNNNSIIIAVNCNAFAERMINCGPLYSPVICFARIWFHLFWIHFHIIFYLPNAYRWPHSASPALNWRTTGALLAPLRMKIYAFYIPNNGIYFMSGIVSHRLLNITNA